MRLVKARPLVEEVALSGFGEDDELGRHGRRGIRLRRRPHEEDEEVAGRAERRARRKLRREQRSERQSLRARQKLQKSRGGRRKSSRGDGGSHAASAMRRPSHLPEPDEVEELETTEESDTPSRPRRRQMRRPMPRPHRAERPDEDDFLDDPFEEDLEDEIEDEALEGTRLELGRAVRRGILAPGSARKVMERVRSQLREGRERRQQRRSPEQTAPQQTGPAVTPGWSPPGSMGHNLRVQARIGHRAAVMELRDGLYLVADISSEAMLPSTQGEEVGAILPALMVRAAAKAIQNRRQNRNALDALQPRQLPGPTAPPLQLHGPIAGCAWSD